MDSLKVHSIRTTFDTLDYDEQQKLAVDLVLESHGLTNATIRLIPPEHPLAGMTWLHKVLGDISMARWKQAIAKFKTFRVKSGRRYIYGDPPDLVKFSLEEQNPQYGLEYKAGQENIITEEYSTFDEFIGSCIELDCEWLLEFGDNGSDDYLKYHI
jgi:hypothetical protein